MGCWLPMPGESSTPVPQSFLYLSQASRKLFNVCVKLVTPGGVIFKFLELKAQVLARFKRLSCVVWS